MHLVKRNYKIYIGAWFVWLALYFASSPCGKSVVTQYFVVITFTSLAFILAWSYSRAFQIDPTSTKKIAILFCRGIYEALLVTLLFVILFIPILAFTPAYECYTERAFASEIIAVISNAKDEVSSIIKESGNVNNDYTRVNRPIHQRIDYFRVTYEGIILVHSIEPDFTIYLTPRVKDNEVLWECKAYPAKISPASCR